MLGERVRFLLMLYRKKNPVRRIAIIASFMFLAFLSGILLNRQYLTFLLPPMSVYADDAILNIGKSQSPSHVVGNLGIGTANPNSKLHVLVSGSASTAPFDDALAVESGANAYLNLIGSSGGIKGITLGDPGNVSDGGIGYNDIATDFMTFRTNSNNIRMVIDSNGNVGIGTQSPGVKLDVNGVGKFGQYAIIGTEIAAGYYQDVTNGAYRARVGGVNTGYYFQRNGGDNTTMYIGLGGTYDGRVGVNTTTPLNSLHVVGNMGATGWIGAGCEASCETSGGYSLMYANGSITNTGTTTSDRMIITGAARADGNLNFSAGNPYIYASSYFVAPGGAYFSAGTVYTEATIQARGGIADDGGNLQLHDSVEVLSPTGAAADLLVNSEDAGTNITIRADASGYTNASATIGVFDGTSQQMYYNWPTLTLGFPIADGANRYVNFRINATNISSMRLDATYTSIFSIQHSLQLLGSSSYGVFTRHGCCAPDNWFRLVRANAVTTYHDLAVGPFYANGAVRFDLAEVTPVDPSDNLVIGELVSGDPSTSVRLNRTRSENDPKLMGIVSSAETASMTIGGDTGPEKLDATPDRKPIALAGRVTTIVNLENGPIKVGDPITSSSVRGVGAKAVTAGTVVSKSMEDFDGKQANSKGVQEIVTTLKEELAAEDPKAPQYARKQKIIADLERPLPPGTGRIITFVGISYFDPDLALKEDGDIVLKTAASGESVVEVNGNSTSRVGAFAKVVTARIQAGLIETEKLIVNGIDIAGRLSELTRENKEQAQSILELRQEIELLNRQVQSLKQ